VAAASGADKSSLRQHLRRQRHALEPEWKAQADAAISRQVLDWQAARGVNTLGIYWPLRGEPDLSAAYDSLAARGVALLLPLVVKRDHALTFVHWTPGEAMDLDAMGIAVPRQRRPAALPPALLVPCLGFTAQRYRLGYGGGFYDRTLAVPTRPVTLGIAYAADEVAFPGDAHDIPLDLILTEQGSWS
jgi:5,10-methenyltetrahydrofolate synthetase